MFVQGVTWPTDLFAYQHLPQPSVDVAIVGSSRASFGLSPSYIARCLGEKLGRPTHSVNLARSFQEASSTELLLPRVFPEGHAPEVLVIGISEEFPDDTNPYSAGLIGAYGGLGDIPGALMRARGPADVQAALWPIARPIQSLALFIGRRYRADDHLRWMMAHHGVTCSSTSSSPSPTSPTRFGTVPPTGRRTVERFGAYGVHREGFAWLV